MQTHYKKNIFFDFSVFFFEHFYCPKALRVLPAETRLTVYRRSQVSIIDKLRKKSQNLILEIEIGGQLSN